MSAIRNGLPVKRKYIYGLLLLFIIAVMAVACSMREAGGFDIAKREVLLRKVGHEILLQSGDSVSRVLPVKKIAEDEYQVMFENKFTFQADSLVNTTRRLLATDPFAKDYIVNVLNCSDASVAYGYAIANNKKDDIIACTGRVQPSACYMINIKFKPAGISNAANKYLLVSLPFLAFVGLIFLKPVKSKKALPVTEPSDIFTLGSMQFNMEARTLVTNEQTIDLTRTESRVLRIFALSPNETIERSRLQKEIWEDEGVIVGRSLDMFISKLRKKLEADQSVKIIVIRGKGYKLDINA